MSAGLEPILLAVPNVSAGQDRSPRAEIEESFGERVAVLDRHCDDIYGRSVFTLAATPGELRDGLLAAARTAKEAGSTRFCMGAAWRCARDGQDFDQVLQMVRGVADLGLEVCCTLGMLTDEQAGKLKDAGLYAYNHNLDSGEAFYDRIISTRTYQDRLDTLGRVRDHDISVCCGGIVGMGETRDDRIDLLHTLCTQPEHPESVPINALIAVEGTPLADQPRVAWYDMARMIAAARTLMPRAMVRLSAGRVDMSLEEQALCFMAGANSIFTGEKLLTTDNNNLDDDRRMFEILGLRPREAYKNAKAEQVPAGVGS